MPKHYLRSVATALLHMWQKTLLLFAVMLCASVCVAKQFTADQYGIEDGLAQMTVTDFGQDKNGFIWVASQAGLDRFDAYGFIHFKSNTNNNDINTLVSVFELHPKTGDMWLGTLTGVNRIDAKTGQATSITIAKYSEDTKMLIKDILVDSENGIWIATNDAIFRYSEPAKRFEVHYVLPSTDTNIHQFIELNNSYFMIATSDGLIKLSREKEPQSTSFLEKVDARSIIKDREGNLWVGSNSKGIFLLKQNISDQWINNEKIKNIRDAKNDSILDMLQNQAGDIWIATTNGLGVIKKTKGLSAISIQRVQINKDYTGALNVSTIFEDKNGVIFYGTLSNGFGTIDPKSVIFDHIAIGENNSVFGISYQNNGTLWAATSNGIWSINKREELQGPFEYKQQESQKNQYNQMTGVHYSHHHEKLFIISRMGLLSIDSSGNRIATEGFEGRSIYSIAETEDGLLWLGFYDDGLVHYNPVTKEIINQWPLPLVLSIFVDTKNNVWAGTVAGLYMFEPYNEIPIKFSHSEQKDNSIHHNVITFITQIGESDYILGTQGRGLSLMQYDITTQQYHFENILPDQEISTLSIGSVVKGPDAELWVTTTRGISKVDLRSKKIEYFSDSEGAQRAGYFINGYATELNGRIHFAGPSGITHFVPEQIKKSIDTPTVKITNISTLDDQDNAYATAQNQNLLSDLHNNFVLKLDPNNLLINIEFAALGYASPDNIKYAYKMEGFENKWREVEANSRTATYSNLDSGQYSFMVKSTDKNGIWQNNINRVSIIIATPWWQTTTAKIIWFAILIVMPFMIYRWRLAIHKNRANRLTALVDEKTSELAHAVAQLEHISKHDPLTNIYNRRGFMTFMNKAFSDYKRNLQPLSILLIDIDRFKNFNDKYGHDVGDKVLINICIPMQKQIRTGDTLARWGGEEFIVLLPNTSLKGALTTAEKLRASVAEEVFSCTDSPIQVTISVGAATASDSDDIETLIKTADEQLYKAKMAGRNTVK